MKVLQTPEEKLRSLLDSLSGDVDNPDFLDTYLEVIEQLIVLKLLDKAVDYAEHLLNRIDTLDGLKTLAKIMQL